MSHPRSLQRNAADPAQVRFAARKEAQRAERFTDALRAVLATPAGRLVLWELIARAGVFRSVWDQSAKIHYHAGRQDYGHELMGLILEADEEAYLVMEREARAWARGERVEASGMQTPPADRDEGA